MRLATFLPVLLLGAAPVMADEVAPPAVPADPPRLILALSVDQFSADLFAQYRQHFTGGLARLQQGVVFPSGYQSHAATETCPGHSTILTGVRPGRNGIIANNWFDPSSPRADKRVYCAEDVTDPASTSRDPVVSARHLKVPTLGEWLKAANPASRNVAVSAKDRSVVMMGGHRIDAGYWLKGPAFVTFKGLALSPAAQAENAAIAALVAKGTKPIAVPAWCGSRDHAVKVGPGSVGTGRFAVAKGKPEALRASPWVDVFTANLATRLLDEMQLGRGSAPDVLSVSFSATDYVGHALGTNGVEMCVQMAELDRTIGGLLAALDKRKIDYAVVLTADHGGLDTPERSDEQALPRAVRADKALLPGELGQAISALTGIKPDGPLLYADGPFGDFYLSRSLTAAQRGEVMRVLLSRVRAHPQVAAVFTHEELANTPMPGGSPQEWSLRDRARASFDAARSGDVVVLLDREVTPIPEPMPGMYVATHGSAFDYDRRVPILFWRKGMAGFEQPAPVETVDIAPTLAALMRLRLPEGTFDGRCLDLDAGSGNTCGAEQ
jgi:predicted AlkP superfamily pyrophosphatase or phosphodiesterase